MIRDNKYNPQFCCQILNLQSSSIVLGRTNSEEFQTSGKFRIISPGKLIYLTKGIQEAEAKTNFKNQKSENLKSKTSF